MTVEELQVLVTANTRGLQTQMNNLTRQLQGVQRQTNTMSQGMSRAFVGLKRTLIGLGIGKMIKSMFDLSRTYEAATQQVNRIFRDNASAIEAWIQKNATTFGMARADAMEYASIYGNLVKGFESDTKKMADYTTQLLQATTVIASSTGRTVEDVSERIRSGLLGNTEAIEDLGIYANVAMIQTTNAFKTVANGRTWDQLTYQEQQQIRLMSILEQSMAQFGGSIQQNTNYQLMQLTANLKNIGLNLGNAFMPIVNVVLPALNSMALALANVTAKLAAFINALFGTNFSAGAGEVKQVAADLGKSGGGASGLADGMDDAAKGADKAGKAAKKAGKTAKGALANFDEINSLAKDSGSDGSGGSGGGGAGGGGGITDTGVVETSRMSQGAEELNGKLQGVIDKLKEMADLFAKGFKLGLGDNFGSKIDDIKKSLSGIKDSLMDIFTNPAVVVAANRLLNALALNAGKIAGSFVRIGTTIAQNLLGGLDKYLAQNKDFIKKRLVGIMDAATDISMIAGNFAVAVADIFDVFGGDTAKQCTANIIAIFENAFLGTAEICMKFGRDVLNLITQPIIANKDKIKQALENSLTVFESLSGTISDYVTEMVENAISIYDQYISPAIGKVADAFTMLFSTALDLYNKYFVPVLQDIAKGFDSLFKSHITPMAKEFQLVFGKLANLIGDLWKNVLAPLIAWIESSCAPAVAAACKIIWDATKGVIELVCDILGDLLKALEGVIDFLDGVFTGDWSKCWEGVKEIVVGLTSTLYDITIAPLLKICEWLASSFIAAWKAAVEGIKNFFAPIGNWFNSAVITPIKNFFTGLWNWLKQTASTCLQGIQVAWQVASGWFNASVITPIKNFFSGMWETLKQLASNCLSGIKAIWQSVSGWFNSAVINPVKTGFSNAWNAVKSLASSCVSGIKSVFNSFKSFISGIVSSIKQLFAKLWSDITNGCRNAINGVMNKVESGINGMADKVNSVTGKVGVKIPTVKLPKLARGGIVDGATNFGNYIAGEAGKEMIVPLENTAFVDKLASSLGNAVMYAMSTALSNLNSIGGNGTQNVQLEMDGMTLARTVTPYIVRELRRLEII